MADFNTRVAQYIKLRDHITAKEKAHKEEIKPFKDTLEKLNAVMLTALNAAGGDSMATASGTVYRTRKKSATIADMSLFWDWVVNNDGFDFVDKKANASRVEEYINEHDGSLPPGVNFTQVEVVGVRRKAVTSQGKNGEPEDE